MKHWIDLFALCFSVAKIKEDFSRKGEVPEVKKMPCSFGSFSVHAVLPAAKNIVSYAVDENLFFDFNGDSSDYSKLNALKAVWNRPKRKSQIVTPPRMLD